MMRRPPAPRRSPDDGFTLVEVLISIMVIGVVMTSLTAFFANSLSITNQQRGKQAAAQVLDGAMERVRALKGSGIAAGRDKQTSDQQWNNPVAGVATYLADMVEAYDSTAVAGDGATKASLPTAPLLAAVNGLNYYQSWYIGECYQALTGGDCVRSAVTLPPSFITLYRVVVAVTWSEKHCPASACSLVATTLVSGVAVEPVFNANAVALPATVTNPTGQTGEVSVPVSLQTVATGGAAPLIFSATGLPTGLTVSSAGLISGTPSAAGTYSVVVSATDAFKLVGSAAFTWTVNPLPAMATVSAQTSPIGNPVALAPSLTGGTGPYAWTAAAGSWGATGLPPGLSLDASTGAITGTPTTAGTGNVTLTVTDKFGKADTQVVKWTVIPRPTISAPAGTRSNVQGDVVSVTCTAAGGTGAYTWSATGLPSGLSINATTGVIAGTITGGTRYLTTVTVTDSLGAPHSVTFVWNVTSTFKVTAPITDRTGDTVGTAVSLALTATGGTGASTWTATGLPPGITLASGKLAGTPTVAGTSTVTLTATDSANKVARMMFTWTVS
jgi:prepilin-type N-terminal cleavage/methylation domain-containing protein